MVMKLSPSGVVLGLVFSVLGCSPAQEAASSASGGASGGTNADRSGGSGGNAAGGAGGRAEGSAGGSSGGGATGAAGGSAGSSPTSGGSSGTAASGGSSGGGSSGGASGSTTPDAAAGSDMMGSMTPPAGSVDWATCGGVTFKPNVPAADFCAKYMMACSFGAKAGSNRYASLADCMTKYGGLSEGDKGGKACVAYYLCIAAQADPDTYCPTPPDASMMNGPCKPAYL